MQSLLQFDLPPESLALELGDPPARGSADDVAAGRCFRVIPVDSYGYPKNGHLILADTSWWVGRFIGHGFERQDETEKSLHKKFDAAMEKISPARRAYYVFSKNGDASKIDAIRNRLDRPV